jgi:hypothetical protein
MVEFITGFSFPFLSFPDIYVLARSRAGAAGARRRDSESVSALLFEHASARFLQKVHAAQAVVGPNPPTGPPRLEKGLH